MTLGQAELFVPFAKVTKNQDGTATVYGKVTSERLDADGQITDLDWFRAELPKWAEWSNIREMHKASAVGIGLATEDTGDAIWLTAEIVDKDAAEKCYKGVYKGYSYGLKSMPGNPLKIVKDTGAPNGRICGGALVEISVVDRPANPEASFSVVKNEALLTKEQEDIKTLAMAAELIRSVTAPSSIGQDPSDGDETTKSVSTGEPPAAAGEAPVLTSEVQTVEAALASVLLALGLPAATKTVAEEVASGAEYKGAGMCAACGHAAGCGCTDCKGCGPGMAKAAESAAAEATKGSTSEEDEVVDKAAVVEFIKGMTAEERTEVGLVTQEDFNALKTAMAEMEKKVQPTGIHLGSALPTGPQSKSGELAELEAEKAMYEPLTKADNPITAQLAQVRLNEIEKAIRAATPIPAA